MSAQDIISRSLIAAITILQLLFGVFFSSFSNRNKIDGHIVLNIPFRVSFRSQIISTLKLKSINIVKLG